MCYHSQQTKTAQELEKRFNVKFEAGIEYAPAVYNGFIHPKTPVISNIKPDAIQLYDWGLIPHWAKDNKIRKNTLNARIETINEKSSYRGYVKNRCLVLADGFYEWQWLDEKGKNKQKYLITAPDNEAFAFAGLWSEWIDKGTGELTKTYTIVTKEANELMSRIHNTKKRMPYILTKENEMDWLYGSELGECDVELVAQEV